MKNECECKRRGREYPDKRTNGSKGKEEGNVRGNDMGEGILQRKEKRMNVRKRGCKGMEGE